MVKPGLRLSVEQVKRVLSNTPAGKEFWVNNGPILRNIIELANAAKKLTPQQFMHHVNNAKNDFAKWADEVIHDSELAKKIRHVKTKDELAHAVKNRLKQLRKLLK